MTNQYNQLSLLRVLVPSYQQYSWPLNVINQHKKATPIKLLNIQPPFNMHSRKYAFQEFQEWKYAFHFQYAFQEKLILYLHINLY